jgi:hypothetical protein
MAGAQGLGLSRMSIPFMLGTIFTANRDLGALIGFVVHLIVGWAFAVVYVLIFESLGHTGAGLGAVIGFGHALFMFLAVMPLMPALHPRMASEHGGPEPTQGLEPPGFFALNYGRWTPGVALVAHIAYGIILGRFYQLVV